MPSALAHINLANRILKLNSSLDKYGFLIGTIKPDCIDFNDDEQYRKSHFIKENNIIEHLRFLKEVKELKQNNYSYSMGYHLHLWFDNINKKLNISDLLKEGIEREDVSIIIKEILVTDLTTIEDVDYVELREICDTKFSCDLVQKVDEIIYQIENIRFLNDSIYFLDSDKYLNYINNLALEYIEHYLG